METSLQSTRRESTTFPNSLPHENLRYQLVLWRKIPGRMACAIYVSPLIFKSGKLERRYLLLDIKMQHISHQPDFAQIWTDMLMYQYRPNSFAYQVA